jgi:Uma2 family endonuclease
LGEDETLAIAVEAGPQEQLVFLKVSWATYEAIVFDLDGTTSGARLAYDGETLELMAPLNDHEAYVSLLDLLLGALMLEWEINLYCTRSSTLKAEPVGAEPDTSYYIEHAGQVGGLGNIDLRTSPPPDLVVEVDISHQRMDKLALYAHLGVPEFWRYGRAGLEAFALRENVYHEITESTVIPGLPLAALGAFLERRLEANRRQVLKDWQVWLRANRPTQA